MPDSGFGADRRVGHAGKRYQGPDITASEDSPNADSATGGGVNPLRGYDLSQYPYVAWDIVVIAGTPTFKYAIWRYVESLARWVQDDEYTGTALGVDTKVEQATCGDRVCLQLKSVTVGGKLRVLVRGLSRDRV